VSVVTPQLKRWATTMLGEHATQPAIGGRLRESGQVLGIDVGYSEKSRTTCFCLLRWTPDTATLSFRATTSDSAKRRSALSQLLHDAPNLDAVAVDGPLGSGLCALSEYRAAEALLSQGQMQKRGKPGQTSSPTGQQLHQHANALAALALELGQVADSCHMEPIHPKCVVEAFPNAFLAALMDESDFGTLSRNASDVYWARLCVSGALPELISKMLPGRVVSPALHEVIDHEERAGTVCALTALSVVRGSYVAVGDPVCGDIILPALAFWGKAATGEPWLRVMLDGAAARIAKRRPIRRGFREARLHYRNGPSSSAAT
jgi:hypothetical protein